MAINNLWLVLLEGFSLKLEIINSGKVNKNKITTTFYIFQMVRHGGCLGLGLAAMGSARQGMICYFMEPTVVAVICM